MTRKSQQSARKRPFRDCIWEGCNDSIASSIARFSETRTARLAKRSRWNPAASLAKSVDAAWSEYVRTLRIPFFEDQLDELSLIEVRTSSSSEKELRSAELRLDRAGRAIYDRGLHVLSAITAESAGNDPALSDLADESKAFAECDWFPAQKELIASLDSIIAVLGLCQRFLPREALQLEAVSNIKAADFSERLVRPEWFGDLDHDLLAPFESKANFDSDDANSPFCTFRLDREGVLCNRRTEFEDYRQGNILDDEKWAVLRGLSVRRCALHRNTLLVPPWQAGNVNSEESSGVHSQEPLLENSMLGTFCDVSAANARRTCRLCPRRSELWAALRAGQSFSIQLSSDFCRHHRPQQKDGSWRRKKKVDLEPSTYESRVEKVWIYQREFSRLNAHAHFRERSLRTAPRLAPDLFARMVIARSLIYADEHFEMARVAWHLVEHDVTDQKKEIVMRVAHRHSQSAIAKEFGISRQAVHGALRSVPKCFRFDLPTEKQEAPIPEA